jgi:hypothetical protein
MKKIINFLMELLGKLPTTNARIAATLAIWLATGIWVIGFGGDPSYEFLGTIIVMSGLDAVQFNAKRKTHIPNNSSSNDNSHSSRSSDVKERYDERNERG